MFLRKLGKNSKRIWQCLTRRSPQVNSIIMRLFYHPDLGSDASSVWNFCSHFSGLKIKKIFRSPFGDYWRNIVTRCKFLVASLYNVNDAAHSMARSIRFDWLKISRTEVSLNVEVNWLCLCNLAHFFITKAKHDRWSVCFYFTLLI